MKKLLVFVLSMLFCMSAYAEDYNVDLVIIGGGWSGLIAAVAANDAGIKTVVLEKQPVIGGGGAYIVGTSNIGGEGAKTPDEAHKAYTEFAHYFPNGSALRALINEVPNNIPWLKAHGVEFLPIPPGAGAARFDGGYGAVARTLNQRLAGSKNVTILTETPAMQLIIDKNGRVTGAIGEDIDGETVRVNAKYTIIATGPILGSPEMVRKYMPYMGEGYRVIGAPGRTGDGITLALQAGAKIDPIVGVDSESGYVMNVKEHIGAVRDQNIVSLYTAANLPYLRVNITGRRFMNEGTPNYQQEAHAISRNNNMYWQIVDDSLRNDLINKGVVELGVPVPLFPALPNPKLTNLNEALEAGMKAGYVYRANTLDELAKLTGMNAAQLKMTVDRYNSFAAKKYDDEFLKDPKYLRNIGKGPYYAIKAEHTIIGSSGGIQSNENLQVINEKLEVIPGLYVTGSMIGSMVGDTYPMIITVGVSSGFGVSGSRMIVDNIKAELKK